MKYRLKQRAVKLCMQAQEDYAKCCSDKVLSVVWACRTELRAFSDCCHQQYVGGPWYYSLHINTLHTAPTRKFWIVSSNAGSQLAHQAHQTGTRCCRMFHDS